MQTRLTVEREDILQTIIQFGKASMTDLCHSMRRNRHEIELRCWTRVQRLANGGVERLLKGNIRPVESDHHQRAAAGD